MQKQRLLSMVHIALMAVFIALCAWICIPFPVPFTMQTAGVYLALLLLGGKKGLCSILIYILMGLAGLPVFSGFSSGFGCISGPTGGYITGFVLCALLYTFAEKSFKKPLHSLLALCFGTILIYIAGALWFMLSTGSTISQALLTGVVPCIIPDAIKLFVSKSISRRIGNIKLTKDQ